MKDLYQLISEKLAVGAPSLRHIDRYNQSTIEGQNTPFLLPAVLIDFGNPTWTRNNNVGVQQGLFEIRIHIFQEIYENFLEGDNTQQKALETFDLIQNIYLVLQDFSGVKFSPLERKSNETPNNWNTFLEDVIVFSTIYTDTSKQENSKYTKVEPDIHPFRIGIDT